MDLVGVVKRVLGIGRAREPGAFAPARRKVLLVGEGGPSAELYALLFRRHSDAYECRHARSLGRALQFIRDESFDTIVMDWRFGDGDGSGHDFLLAVRRGPRSSEVPVIVVADEADHGEASAHGATACLPGSCDAALLLDRLRIHAGLPA